MVTGRLVLILGDQLSASLSSLKAADPKRDVIIMGEVASEATYVGHHKKKLAFVFSAMRHFAEELRAAGWRVEYAPLDRPKPFASLTDLVADAAKRLKSKKLVVTEPGEWRVLDEIETWSDRLNLDVTMLDDDRFLCSHADFEEWAGDKKSLRMEYFYREMRRRTGLLMDGDEPAGGAWNYDQENRKPPPAKLVSAGPLGVEPDDITRDVLKLVNKRFPDNFGDLEPFWFAVTRQDAEAARDRFIADSLPRFGDYQDAMLRGEAFLYHSILGLYINIGLLDPIDVCRRAEAAYQSGAAPLNSVEGFIRQIIGWREYVRGIYWREGRDYTSRNYFKAERALPEFFWTGQTKMACVAAVIQQTREEAYAHHIQRLMVTGVFALIAGLDPHAVHEWYLAVYADAYEWVEAPNVIGMSQFADGGALASKPYAASGAYINRMSNYCSGCAYSVKKRTEPDACPFNSLYWD